MFVPICHVVFRHLQSSLRCIGPQPPVSFIERTSQLPFAGLSIVYLLLCFSRLDISSSLFKALNCERPGNLEHPSIFRSCLSPSPQSRLTSPRRVPAHCTALRLCLQYTCRLFVTKYFFELQFLCFFRFRICVL